MTWKAKYPAALDIAMDMFKVVFDNTRDSENEAGCAANLVEDFVTTNLAGILGDWTASIQPADESKDDTISQAPPDDPATGRSGIPEQVKDAPPDINATITDLGFAVKKGEDIDALNAYYIKAKGLTRTYVKLLVEESTVQKMATKISEQSIGEIEGKALQTHTQYFGFLYCMNLSGEVATAPHVRMPSFKKECWQKAVDTFLKLRGDPSVFPETDVAIMLDGYKHGLKTQIMSAFGTTMKDETTYSLIYDADQLQARLGCVRGWKMQQVEWQHAVHNPNGLNLKIRNRSLTKDTTGVWISGFG